LFHLFWVVQTPTNAAHAASLLACRGSPAHHLLSGHAGFPNLISSNSLLLACSQFSFKFSFFVRTLHSCARCFTHVFWGLIRCLFVLFTRSAYIRCRRNAQSLRSYPATPPFFSSHSTFKLILILIRNIQTLATTVAAHTDASARDCAADRMAQVAQMLGTHGTPETRRACAATLQLLPSTLLISTVQTHLTQSP